MNLKIRTLSATCPRRKRPGSSSLRLGCSRCWTRDTTGSTDSLTALFVHKFKKGNHMNANNDFRLLDLKGKTIAMGTKEQMFSYLKHHVPDGSYRIVGSDIKLHCLRKNGIVEPDPDGVCL